MHRSLAAVLVIAAFVLLSDAGTAARADRKAAREFHERACASYPRSSSPWHVTNLYDCKCCIPRSFVTDFSVYS